MQRTYRTRRIHLLSLVVAICLSSGSPLLARTEPFRFEQWIEPSSDLGSSEPAVDGNLAVVGDPSDDELGNQAGAAYLFQFDGIRWVELTKFFSRFPATGEKFGQDVALDGDRIVVGAPDAHGRAPRAGAVYVYRWTGTEVEYEARLIASDGDADDLMGYSVDLSQDVILAGAYNDRNHWGSAGSAYAYRWNGTFWTEEQRILPPDAYIGDLFGWSVAIDADTAVIGARWDDDRGADSGSAYVFTHSGSQWFFDDKLTASNGSSGAQFGFSVDISGSRIVVGASSAGASYAFRQSGSTWIEDAAFAGDAGNPFGGSVTIHGTHLVLGARTPTIFELAGGTWQLVQTLENPSLPSLRVALGGGSLFVSNRDVVGAWRYGFGAIDRCKGVEGLTAVRVNGSHGGATGHTVSVDSDGPIRFEMQRPATGGSGKFVVHLNEGPASGSSTAVLPRNLGLVCFPMLISQGSSPVAIWNSIGKEIHVGSSHYFGSSIPDPSRAPTEFLSLPTGDAARLPIGSRFTIQGVIANPAASASKPASVTNAIEVNVE